MNAFLKSYTKSKTFFLLFAFFIILFEGLNIGNGRVISYFLVIVSPFFLYLADLISYKRILVPKKISFLFGLFLLFSTISTLFSINIQQSVEYLFLYTSLFLIFIYIFNHKEELFKPVLILLVFFSAFFSAYSLALRFFLGKLTFLLPSSGYNLVFPSFPPHNHLGDYLAIPIIIAIYYIFHNKHLRYLWLMLMISIPFFLFSYSRSAYLAIMVLIPIMLTMFYGKKINRIIGLTVIFTFAISFFFFFASTKEAKKQPLLAKVYASLEKDFGLKEKTFLGGRQEYFSQSFAMIKQFSFFGVGPGNFSLGSLRYQEAPDQWSESSHNLFLDISSENGILAGLIFSISILLIICKSKKNLYFLLFLLLLINFQADYIHRMYLFFFLFFVFGGFIYEETSFISKKYVLIAATIIVVLAQLRIISDNLLTNSHNNLALLIYPFQKAAYQQLVKEDLKTGNYQTALSHINKLNYLYKGDCQVLDFLGTMYIKTDEKEKALYSFKQAYNWCPFQEFNRVREIYNMTAEIYGKRDADNLLNTYINKVRKIKTRNTSTINLFWQAQQLCNDIYIQCPFEFFY